MPMRFQFMDDSTSPVGYPVMSERRNIWRGEYNVVEAARILSGFLGPAALIGLWQEGQTPDTDGITLCSQYAHSTTARVFRFFITESLLDLGMGFLVWGSFLL